MKAGVFLGQEAGIEIVEVPDPVAGPADLLITVAACGICHTDLHYLDHGIPTAKAPPLILGHEVAGTVKTVGAEVAGWSPGDHVLVPAVLTCGHCRMCRTGRENICSNMQMVGSHIDGGFAELMAVPAKDCLHLPDTIPLEQAALIADAVSTPYHAVKNRAKVRPGDWVLAMGCGGVGLNVVQLAVLAGGRVIACDLDPDKLALAKSFGAEIIINGAEVERVDKEVKRLTRGGADIAIEAIGNPATITTAFNSLRRGGRFVMLGYTDVKVPLAMSKIMFLEMEIVGTLGCRPVDYPPLIDLVAQGRLQLAPLVSATYPLTELAAGLDHLRSGKGIRIVITPGSPASAAQPSTTQGETHE